MKPGTLVVIWRDNGEAFITTTKSEVFKDESGTSCISVHGISGWYAASHIRPITSENINPTAYIALGACAAGEI